MANSRIETVRTSTCPTHGPFTSTCYSVPYDRWTDCPLCREARESEEEAKLTQALARERLQRRMIFSGLQGRFLNATFANFFAETNEQRFVLNECKNFVDTFKDQIGGVTLVGKPGTGKTHLGSAMVSSLIREHDTAAMIFSSREIVRMLRSTWGDRGQSVIGRYESVHNGHVEVKRPSTEMEMLEMFGGTPLLVIDEVGVQFGSDAEMVQMFEVIDMRYRNELPTVILSNLTGIELKAALGDRGYDRIRENGKFLACKWESHRRGFASL